VDVTVSSLSSATSLVGGVLLQTPLVGGDNQVYAIAQGALSVGGFGAQGIGGTSSQKNHLTTARVAAGAIVERELAFEFGGQKSYVLALRRPDFTTAQRIAKAVNDTLGESVASAKDPGTVEVRVPQKFAREPVSLFASLEGVLVTPDRVARVVIAERTGTVVMGSEVRIAMVAVSHGNLNIQITTQWSVSQPQAFATGVTVPVPQSDVSLREGKRPMAVIPRAVTIGELVRALNALGATPRDLISILQAIRAAGALEAELEVL
jgi:flagellar P-ring protein precursor FlgI